MIDEPMVAVEGIIGVMAVVIILIFIIGITCSDKGKK